MSNEINDHTAYTPKDKQQESAAFEQCRKRRPQDGFGLAALTRTRQM